jgi:thimet oligopeptidase
MRATGFLFGAAIAVLGLTGAAQPPASASQVPSARDLDSFLAELRFNPRNANEVAATCTAYEQRIAALKTALEAETGPARIETTFRRYDDLQRVMDATGGDIFTIVQTHPEAAVRDAARACVQRLTPLQTEIALSRPIYNRLKAIDASRADPVVRQLLARSIGDYERSGVATDDATRARITALQQRMSETSLAFERNIAQGRKEVTATAAELEGLPADYLASHRPGPDGRVRITTDYPDLNPVMTYASNEGLRRRLAEANLTRAYPDNDVLLRQLFTDRAELARLLGRPDYATLVMEDKMIGSPANTRRFLDEIDQIARPASDRDQALLLARLKQINPAATEVPLWSTGYLSQLIRREQYDVDPQEVRRYFAYNNVRDGILRLTEDLFGLDIRPWQTQVWHPSVEAYEIYENNRLIGRFYLDNHPRDGKYTHAQHIGVRNGIEGRAIPVSILVQNFPAGDHSTGLMEHGQVETFLHEFGHLLHNILSGRQQWAQANYSSLERDFIEAPSQMLENWVWDYDTLSRFAVNAEGQTIPRALVERMNRARGFVEAFNDRRQLALASTSLQYHLAAPGEPDLTSVYRTAYNRYSPIPVPDGVHPHASFGHLTSYSAVYYTYPWSKTISTDLFSRFQENGIRDAATARRYRDLVLAPGSSKPARQLVEDFLGRPMNLDAYRARLTRRN